MPPPEKKIEVKLKKFKRIGRCGLVYVSRSFTHPDFPLFYEPDCNQTPVALTAALKEGLAMLNFQDGSTRSSLNHEQSLVDIYIPSDSEENTESQDKLPKGIGTGFRNYSKQKKKLSSERIPGNFTEPS